MNRTEINADAAKDAATFLWGETGVKMLDQLYKVIAAAEERGNKEAWADAAAYAAREYNAGFADGHSAGYKQGVDTILLPAPQPEVLMPDTDQDGAVLSPPATQEDKPVYPLLGCLCGVCKLARLEGKADVDPRA